MLSNPSRPRPESGHHHARLANGVSIVGVPMPTPSVCFALYLSSGSLHEPAELNGVTHLIEHLFFKGTRRHTAEQHTERIAAIGAEANAFTWWLGVCCHARVLRRHWAACLELLVEEMTEPLFTDEALVEERPVVLQEMARMQTSPKHAAIQALMTARYPDHPLGRPVVGTDESLAAIGLPQVRAYFADILRPRQLTLVVAGGFDWDEVREAAAAALGGLSATGPEPPPPPPPPAPTGGMRLAPMDVFPYVHLAYGFPAAGYRDDDYFACQLLAMVLGDETRTGSRLLHRVQQRHLVHEAFSGYQAYDDHGILYTLATTTAELAPAAHRAILDEFDRLSDVDADELRRACRKLVSRIAVDGETSQKRALAAARLYTGAGRLDTLEQLAERFRAVTIDDLRNLIARHHPERDWVGVALGPVHAL